MAGAIYRGLFLAGQRGLAASGHGADTILIGETSPGPGRGSTNPITFLRQTLCLDARYRRRQGCAPVTASGWAHHPYDLRGSPLESSSRKLVTIASLGKLTTALARAAKANATTRRLPVYVTEYGVETVPDASNGVSFGVQAAYLGLAEMLLWSNPQVRSYAQYLLRTIPAPGPSPSSRVCAPRRGLRSRRMSPSRSRSPSAAAASASPSGAMSARPPGRCGSRSASAEPEARRGSCARSGQTPRAISASAPGRRGTALERGRDTARWPRALRAVRAGLPLLRRAPRRAMARIR